MFDHERVFQKIVIPIITNLNPLTGSRELVLKLYKHIIDFETF